MKKFIHNAIVLTTLVLGWIMIAVMIVVLGACVFYTTYVTLELPDYSFLIYSLFACIVLVKQAIESIKAFKDSKLWYNDHIKE